MTIRPSLAVLCLSAALCAGGCSDEAKKVEPKLAPGTKADPRLKPEQTGDPSPPPQQAVKGD